MGTEVMPLNWHRNLLHLDTNGADRLKKKYVQHAASSQPLPESAGPWTWVLGKRSVLTAVSLALASGTNQQFSVSSRSSLGTQRDNEMASSFIPGPFLIVHAIPCLCH